MNGVMRRLAARRAMTASLTLLIAGAGLTSAAMSAGAATTRRAPRSAVVVEERTHAPFGKILYTTHHRALYYVKSGSCTGGCLSVWPPLLMPKGKTMPKGASCLATAKFGRRLQVTYRHHRLYTFINDSGGSVTGNGVEGFAVARVVKCT